jgi:WD40 repeat protein
MSLRVLTDEISHWQLRSLISSPEPHIVYYPSGSDVVALNTKTREREVIAKLPFFPRCLTASKDWLCCGAESGQYTAISLKERSEDSGSLSGREADPDERLPLELDPSRRSTTRETNSSRRSPSRPLLPEPVKIGTEIVNCVTLWSPGETISEKAYDFPVAVIANNDCTVAILNLQDSEVLEKLTLPDFVNRSVISPDGQTLVTICDDPFLYIHERREKAGFRKQRFETKDVQRYEWVLAGKIQLEGQRATDKSENRGSFTACFSPSGRYLAVATQYGVISVFDAQCLMDYDSVKVIFTTSRPGASNGAVRSMEFSPAPLDLLVSTHTFSGSLLDLRLRVLGDKFNCKQVLNI